MMRWMDGASEWNTESEGEGEDVPSGFPNKHAFAKLQLILLSTSSAASPIVYVPTCDTKSARGYAHCTVSSVPSMNMPVSIIATTTPFSQPILFNQFSHHSRSK